MRISELINKLKNIKEKDGDIEVVFQNRTSRSYSGNVEILSSRDEEIENSEKECSILCRNPISMEIGEVREYRRMYYKAMEGSRCDKCDLAEECTDDSRSFFLGECEEFERDQEDTDIYFKKVRKPKKIEPKFDITETGEKQYRFF